ELHPQPDGEQYCWFGNYKKDITKRGDLSTTILADNDKSWAMSGQEANFLRAPGHIWFGRLLEIFGKKDAPYITLESYLAERESDLHDLLLFYKLLYITGILDKAAQHATSSVKGLYTIQFAHTQTAFEHRVSELREEPSYYKKGYSILSEYTQKPLPHYFPQIESFFAR
ncbi:hypothetical protein H0W26_03955, partial [Candidatus Dependentiae bacterium]|nr:hypothetical protein [Candidatus Dependentiae bacterium]